LQWIIDVPIKRNKLNRAKYFLIRVIQIARFRVYELVGTSFLCQSGLRDAGDVKDLDGLSSRPSEPGTDFGALKNEQTVTFL